jgi:hypothetical protein
MKILVISFFLLPFIPKVKVEYAEFAHPSKNYDTLYLLEGDGRALLLKQIWDNDSSKSVTIEFVNENKLKQIKNNGN